MTELRQSIPGEQTGFVPSPESRADVLMELMEREPQVKILSRLVELGIYSQVPDNEYAQWGIIDALPGKRMRRLYVVTPFGGAGVNLHHKNIRAIVNETDPEDGSTIAHDYVLDADDGTVGVCHSRIGHLRGAESGPIVQLNSTSGFLFTGDTYDDFLDVELKVSRDQQSAPDSNLQEFLADSASFIGAAGYQLRQLAHRRY